MLYLPCCAVGAAVLVLAGCTTPHDTSVTAKNNDAAQCKATSETEISALFEHWNQALQTADPRKVVASYAERSILLPTLSNTPRLTPAEKEDYFRYFMKNGPSGKVQMRQITLGCNSAVDTGLYAFYFSKTGTTVEARYTYAYRWDGTQWRITSHHSSALPEKK